MTERTVFEHSKSNETEKPENVESTELVTKYIGTDLNYKHEVYWSVVIFVALFHVFALWGLLLVLNGEVHLYTILWSLFVFHIGAIGISIGAHRLYSHRSFKATPPLEVILVAFNTISGQNSIFTWVRDHRLHHRYSDTDGDPHNFNRGFFFCYMGWTVTKRNKIVQELGKRIDMSDLMANKFVMFQKRYYVQLYLLLGVLIPVLIPVYAFNETWSNSLFVAYFFRYVAQLNLTWTLVVFGHSFGTRPFDKNIQPVENWVFTILSMGEGNHNYHHVFPWDYRTAEWHNLMSVYIWLWEKLGLAYGLKEASGKMVKDRVTRTGDGTHHVYGTNEGKTTTTAIGPQHPWNPTYRSIKDPDVLVRVVGPKTMFHSEENVERNVRRAASK